MVVCSLAGLLGLELGLGRGLEGVVGLPVVTTVVDLTGGKVGPAVVVVGILTLGNFNLGRKAGRF